MFCLPVYIVYSNGCSSEATLDLIKEIAPFLQACSFLFAHFSLKKSDVKYTVRLPSALGEVIQCV